MLFRETESPSPLNSNLIIEYRDPLKESAVTTIAFVDSRVSDAMTLMAGLQADVKVLLDPTRDGIAQITETLGHYQNLTGIDIISHGNVAQVQLGNSFLSANSLQQYAHELKQWESALIPDADLLFYGCNIAAEDLGQTFVKDISTLTGADVAASTDLTGNSALGGNWNLEYATGSIETKNPLTEPLMNSYQGLLASVFTTQTPTRPNITDGSGSEGDYELGMEFTSAKVGQISAIRYYKAASETGSHTGRIWSSTGTLLASVTFSNETASGWQQQALATPLTIQANTTYIVSVNTNSYYVATNNGLATTLTNGDLSAIADGSNGVYNTTPGNFPTQSFQNSNYFRDIVFTPTAVNPNNNPGAVTISGTTTQNQILIATVSDADISTDVTINYQWQQSNGTTWTNITGATTQMLMLGQAQVGKLVRTTASYTDSLGSSENITSTATSSIVNVNDVGTVAITGIVAQGSTLTANVTDADGLTGVNINYQWQLWENNTWTNINGASNQNLTLDSSLVGKQVHVTVTYTDVLGGNENILSPATRPISASILESLFTTQTPTRPNITDGSGSAGDYELGMEFRTAKAGQIQAIRYYKAPSETGTHVGKIWSTSGQLLASATFTNETASGWQQQTLATPLTIQGNTTYIVSVNTNSYYVATNNGLATTLTNGDLSAIADGSNGVYNTTPGNFPTQSFQNSNYFRDIVFSANSNYNNNLGTVNISGTETEDQTLTANISELDGVDVNTIAYQWQQSSDDGTTWTNIVGATSQTLILGDAQVNKRVRVRASYIDKKGSSENLISAATFSVVNINDLGLAILAGSATSGASLKANIFDADGLTGVTINYQWQQLVNSIWTNITGATSNLLTLGASLVGQQVRATASYIDALSSSENIFSLATSIADQNAIVLENQKTGTTAWKISNLATNNEIAGYGDATSINKGQALNLKISLAQAGQYRIDVYRLGYYGGTGGRLITSVTGLNGVVQASPTMTNASTKLVEWNWNTSYTLQTGSDWTTGLYLANLTDSRTGKQTYVQFVLRDDNRPADIGFQDSVSTTQAYNNYGGYSVYDANSSGGQRAYQVSFDRPLAAANLGLTNTDGYNTNNMLAWEYNMVRWQESQGYDVSYFTNIDTSINPLQLYSQNVFQVTGHDEYWSMDMMNNVTNARDKGINLAFFSANTAYWQVRFEPSSSGQANRVMTVYKDTSGIGISGDSLDPVTVTNPSAATTLFRSSQVNRPENALMGVGYLSDTPNIYGGYDFVVSNALDPYYANTGLKNGDKLRGLVGYEWDGLLNNGFAPPGLVVLSQSPVQAGAVLPPLPSGTNPNISNAVRYTAASGAKVFSTGSVQWVWGLDSDNVINPRVDIRAQQITVNVLKDMGAKPQTPSSGIVV